MMAPVRLHTRSLEDALTPAHAHPDVAQPTEYNDKDYIREVLQIGNGQTEAVLDELLLQEAEQLGITIVKPPPNTEDVFVTDLVPSHHSRTGSTSSYSTGASSRSSYHCKRSSLKSLSFTGYEKYLAQTQAQDAAQCRQYVPPLVPIPSESATSVFSMSKMKSYASIKIRLKNRLRLRRDNAPQEGLNSCVCCRDDFQTSSSLKTLPCRHKYCEPCLRILITQSMTDEAKMPPRCCSQPIPSAIIKLALTRDDQRLFMKAVSQFSTPWEARMFCPNPGCGEFIPKRNKINPRHPFEVICRNCRTVACSTCKRPAHAFGQDCPADWELEAVLQMGEKSGWRRCNKCRTLVELAQGCSHITCRCKAQFCYICGAVWDQIVGCPNFCNGEEELERRRLEEEARAVELEKEKAAREEEERLEGLERAEAEKRTLTSKELNALKARQIDERERFALFERRMKWMMWTRHGQSKLEILDRYGEALAKMKERHARTATHLEDRQVDAEMELRAGHKQAERSVKIRLRHMEAYCDGIGRSASGMNPARTVTERDLRELGQQYNLCDDLERLHQSKINVMRDKQAKQMEQLLTRQEEELEMLDSKQNIELDALEESFVAEEDGFFAVFEERRARVRSRWEISEEILRTKLEAQKKVKFAPMVPVEFEAPHTAEDGGLDTASE